MDCVSKTCLPRFSVHLHVYPVNIDLAREISVGLFEANPRLAPSPPPCWPTRMIGLSQSAGCRSHGVERERFSAARHAPRLVRALRDALRRPKFARVYSQRHRKLEIGRRVGDPDGKPDVDRLVSLFGGHVVTVHSKTTGKPREMTVAEYAEYWKNKSDELLYLKDWHVAHLAPEHGLSA